MGRHPEKLSSEKQQAFVEAATECRGTLAQAAEEAGYADPHGEVDRLLKNPKVAERILAALQPKLVRLVRYEMLYGRALDALMHNLDPENWKSIGVTRAGVPVFAVPAQARNEAAKIVINMLQEVDPDVLSQRAREGDTKETLRSLADKVMVEITAAQEGEGADVGPPALGDGGVVDAEFLPISPSDSKDEGSDPAEPPISDSEN